MAIGQKITLTIVRSEKLFQQIWNDGLQTNLDNPVARESWFLNLCDAPALRTVTNESLQKKTEAMGHFRNQEEARFAALYTLVQEPLVDRHDVLLDGSKIEDEQLMYLFQALRNTADWLDLDKEESGNEQVMLYSKTRQGIRTILRED